MAEESEHEVAARRLAEKYGISTGEAREICRLHGSDETKLERAARNVAHFLKAPS